MAVGARYAYCCQLNQKGRQTDTLCAGLEVASNL